MVAKVVPALVAGNTVVLKPSEVAPLTADLLAEIIAEAGLPAGVFNMVHGTGPVVGEALAAHPDVDMVSFTGSTRAGRRVSAVAAETVKRVALELGGKSACVVLDDADLGRRAVKIAVANCVHEQRPGVQRPGPGCWCPPTGTTRPCGSPRPPRPSTPRATRADPSTRIGPAVSTAQRDRVVGYIRKGVEEGAQLAAGGPEAPLPQGFYVTPTVFGDVTPDMTIAQEEIFGPVLSVMSYADEDDAMRIANSTIYGLAGGVFSADTDRALARGEAVAHRAGGHQRRRVQHQRAVRRLPAVRQRA